MCRHYNLDFPLASAEEQKLEGQSKKRDRIEVGGGREGEKEREKEQERVNDIKEPNSFDMQYCSDLYVQPTVFNQTCKPAETGIDIDTYFINI